MTEKNQNSDGCDETSFANFKKVSILIPAYKPDFIEAAITSALAQTYPNKEIIISDDSQGDKIQRCVEKYAGLITYLKNPNFGDFGKNNIKFLIDISTGFYIKFLFDDDILHPFCLDYMVKAFETYEHLMPSLVFSRSQVIDKTSFIITSRDQDRNGYNLNDVKIFHYKDYIKDLALSLHNKIGEFSSVMFKKEYLIGDKDSSIFMLDGLKFDGLGDIAAFISMSEKGPLIGLPEILSYFRIHGTSNTESLTGVLASQTVTDWKRILDYAIKNNILSESETLITLKKIIIFFNKSARDSYAHENYDIANNILISANLAVEEFIARASYYNRRSRVDYFANEGG